MASKLMIDLNQPPPIDHEILGERGDISISSTTSSPGSIVIELDTNNDEIGYPIIELDLRELQEAADDTSLYSSEEEIIADQNGRNYTATTNDEIMGIMQNQQTTQGNIREMKRRVLTDSERWAIYRVLLEKSVDGKLKKNTTKEVQEMFNIKNVRTIQRIWKIHKGTLASIDVDVSSRRKKNCGRKRIEVDLRRVREVALPQRTTIISLSEALGVSYSTMYRLFKKGVLRRHSSAIKPYLKEENKVSRLVFCLSMLDESTILNDPKFKRMHDYVHIDEKWFYMTEKDQTYYLFEDEEDPDRSCQSKNFISKVMFLAATARPRFDDEGRVIFDGKIGCWPFVTEQAAQRNSIHRNAGTMEMKAITSVKRETIKGFLIEKVIPAIHEKWPRSQRGEIIFIQQDNARTHVPPNDPDFLTAASSNGWDI